MIRKNQKIVYLCFIFRQRLSAMNYSERGVYYRHNRLHTVAQTCLKKKENENQDEPAHQHPQRQFLFHKNKNSELLEHLPPLIVDTVVYFENFHHSYKKILHFFETFKNFLFFPSVIKSCIANYQKLEVQ